MLTTWLWRRERRKRRKLQEQLTDAPPTYEMDPETKAVYAHAHVHEDVPELIPQEIGSGRRSESSGTSRPKP